MLNPPKLTCRIANLCISPVHAGIMSLSTENSSFILDLRRRSIRLCAVFLAVFRPAALVADDFFFFAAPGAVSAVVDVVAARLVLLTEPLPYVGCSPGLFSSRARGFIWMIFLDLVGGGGSVKLLSLLAAVTADERLLDLTASLGCIRKGVFGDAWDSGETGTFMLLLSRFAARESMAGGGSSKAICSCNDCLIPSWPFISVEEAGVGGNAVCGILQDWARMRAVLERWNLIMSLELMMHLV